MQAKFPIGSRVGSKVVAATFAGNQYEEVPMRVTGYDGLKGVIVEFLVDHGPWEKGQMTIVAAKSLTRREEVKHIPGEPENEEGPAIGWVELDGLSVGLTRSQDGTLLVSLDRSPDATTEDPIKVRVIPAANDTVDNILWEGEI